MKKCIPILFFLLVLAAAVAGWILLPDPVSVAFGFRGESPKTLPKLLALGAGVVIGGFGAYQAAGEEQTRKAGYIMLILAAAVLGLLFWVNR